MKKITLLIALSGLVAVSLQARPGKPPIRPEPETVVVDLFEFDADENDSLSQSELITGFTELHARRMAERPRKERKPSDGESVSDRPAKPRKDGPRGPRDPERMASRIIERFDENGDSELSAAETLNALSTMQRGPRRGPRSSEPEESVE